MLSSRDSPFTTDMGFQEDVDGRTQVLPGISTFRRREDGRIVRVARAPFGPGDPFCGIWHMFDLLAGGGKDWAPKFSYD